ncbi:MAG: hypothetical protein ACD_23C00751G0015 [uncultured bacterium]|jgi:hypothetical protein|nr:MAG: hypothetical protein ACD_23C00751G0015 [uncultured bacterium]
MANDEYGYVEHQTFEVDGFRVADATSTGPRPHDDLVWVGHGGMEGRWLTPEAALDLAAVINQTVAVHVARRAKPGTKKPIVWDDIRNHINHC